MFCLRKSIVRIPPYDVKKVLDTVMSGVVICPFGSRSRLFHIFLQTTVLVRSHVNLRAAGWACSAVTRLRNDNARLNEP